MKKYSILRIFPTKKSKKLTQVELPKKLGVTDKYIENWKNDRNLPMDNIDFPQEVIRNNIYLTVGWITTILGWKTSSLMKKLCYKKGYY